MIPRLYVSQVCVDAPISLQGEHVNYLKNVLRLTVGDKICLFCGDGCDYECQITEFGKREVVLEFRARIPKNTDPRISVKLILSLLKGDKMSDVIRGASALGVTKLYPFAADRSVAKPSTSKIERWQKIAEEASRQCGRTTVPEIMDFSEGGISDISHAPSADGETIRLFFYEGEGNSLGEVLKANRSPSEVIIAVGPEGGWSHEEVRQARESGWSIVHLGKRILRAELFSIVALSVVLDNLGEL